MAEAREADRLGVFISYSRADVDFADQLALTLEFAGFMPTLDRHDIHGSEKWKEKLNALIRDADTVVFVLSPASAISKMCKWEADQALQLGKRIIPIVCRSLEEERPPEELSELNFIHFFAEPKIPGSSYRSGMVELIQALKTDFGWMRRHTRLLQLAIEWDSDERKPSRLLSSDEIIEAQNWVVSRPKDAPPPTGLHLDFIKASEVWDTEQKNENRLRLEERERLLVEREDAQTREADERARREAAQIEAAASARRERDKARLVSRVTFAGLIATALLGGAAVFAYLDAQRAKDQAQTTESRLLANAASTVLGDDNRGDAATAALLAFEALPNKAMGVERPPSPEATLQLDRALQALHELKVLSGHTSIVEVATFDAQGHRIVTASSDMTARVWDSETGKLVALLDGHEAKVVSAEFSRDGTRVLTASSDMTARIWDAETGRELHRLEGHLDRLRSAAFSPDGLRVVTASVDATARIWDAKTGKELVLLDGRRSTIRSTIRSAVFSPDGKSVLTASEDKTARIWNSVTGAEMARLVGHKDVINKAVFNHEGTRVVTASVDKTARVWDVVTGREPIVLQDDGQTTVWNAVFSADGTKIVTSSADGAARVWDTETGKRIAVLVGNGRPGTVDKEVNSAVFNGDGTRVVTASDDGTARIWDAQSGKEITRFIGHMDKVWSAAFSPGTEGSRVVTASSDSTVRIWDATSGGITSSQLNGHQDEVTDAQYSPDGSKLVTASKDKTARIWDAQSLEELFKLEGHQGSIRTATFSPDGSRIVTVAKHPDFKIRVWNAQTGVLQFTIGKHERAVNQAVFSPGGEIIATASFDYFSRTFDAKTGAELSAYKHGNVVRSAAASPDGKRVVSTSDDQLTVVWDAATGKEIARLKGHTGKVWSVVFDSSGTRILTASEDGTARVWNASTGKEAARLKGHKNGVNSASFNSDGTRVVTTSDDLTVRVWDVATEKEIGRLEGHGGNITSAVFSPDGQRVLTACEDKIARVWEASTGALIASYGAHDGAVKSAAFNSDGSSIVTASADKTARVWRSWRNTEDLVAFADAKLPRCLSRIERRSNSLSEAVPRRCVEGRQWPYDEAASVVSAGRHLDNKDTVLALEDAQRAIDLADASPAGEWIKARAHSLRGRAYDATGREQLAKADFEAAGLRALPNIVGYFKAKGREGDNTDVSTKAFATALQWASRDTAHPQLKSGTLFARGVWHDSNGQGDLARADFGAAGSKFVPSIVKYYRDKAEVIDRLQPDAKLAAFTAAVDWSARDGANPVDRADALTGRGAVYFKNDLPRALGDFEEAASLGNKDAVKKLLETTMKMAGVAEFASPIDALLIAMPHTLAIAPTMGQTQPQTVLFHAMRLANPIGNLYGQLTHLDGFPPAQNACDAFAGFPYDPMRVSEGLREIDIQPGDAVKACEAAVSATTNEPRLVYQLARAYAKAADTAKSAEQADIAEKLRKRQIAALNAAKDSGYAVAFNNLAYLYENGEGVGPPDNDRAAALRLEYFNRIAKCCAARVMRHLIDNETKYGVTKVRQTAAALASWSADLGSAEAHELVAELARDGRIEQPSGSSASAVAIEHLKIAERIYTAGGNAVSASRAAASSEALKNSVTAEEMSAAETRAASWIAADIATGRPPWVRSNGEVAAADK